MRIAVHPDVTVRQAGDEVILLGADRNASYWRLNATAGRMLALLAEGRPVEDVADALAATTGADPATIEEDVLGLVGSLVGAGLARREP